jgi:uncharacterized membrane protein
MSVSVTMRAGAQRRCGLDVVRTREYDGSMGYEPALPRSIPRRAALILLAVFFVLAGANHFVATAFYLSLMPPFLPAHVTLIYLTGILEILGGLGVLVPVTRRVAGWCLAALMVAFLPVHIHMAAHPESYAQMAPAWALYLRLPLQAGFIAWALWATAPETRGGWP